VRNRIALVATLGALSLGLAACGGGDDTAGTTTPSEDMTSSDSMTSDSSMTETEDAMAEGPVGPGCADYAAAVPDGAGSVDGMAQDPVATAASNNPLLTTLVAAVSGQLNPGVDLVDTLNGDEFTVFAPVDDAFAADVDAATLETLGTDAELLSSILTYHVVPGQLSPEDVVGTQTTVQGGTVEVAGEPDALTVNGANVICGGVQTANATVYLIDGVLMPTM
jgi:uncharacterized surface protein with fasciclin (FAS1) repeats